MTQHSTTRQKQAGNRRTSPGDRRVSQGFPRLCCRGIGEITVGNIPGNNLGTPNAITAQGQPIYETQPDGSVVFRGFQSIITISTNASTAFNNGSAYDNAITLLHELGHVYANLRMATAITPDNNLTAAGVAASQTNAALVRSRCPQ